jgi:Predicted transcriptional regulator
METEKGILSQNLRILRKKHGYSQQTIADILSISRSAYTYYETAKTTPSIYILEKLSKLYNIELAAFLSSNPKEKISKNTNNKRLLHCDSDKLLWNSPSFFNNLYQYKIRKKKNNKYSAN